MMQSERRGVGEAGGCRPDLPKIRWRLVWMGGQIRAAGLAEPAGMPGFDPYVGLIVFNYTTYLFKEIQLARGDEYRDYL